MKSISNILNKTISDLSSRQENNKSFSQYSHSKKNSRYGDWYALKFKPVPFPTPTEDILRDPEHFFMLMTPAEKLVLNCLLFFNLKYGVVVPSQSTLARHAGVTRSYVNTVIKRFVAWGILNKGYRHRRPCFYNISEWFSAPHVRSRLSHIFKALRIITFFALSSLCSKTSTKPHLTPDKNRTIGINYIYNKYRPLKGSMEQFSRRVFGDNPISPEIRSVTQDLKLTKWGQIRLSAFPDEAILYAKEKLSYAKTLQEPFAWFFKVCLEYCSDENINPDWQWMHTLMDSYKMPMNAPLTIDNHHKNTVDKDGEYWEGFKKQQQVAKNTIPPVQPSSLSKHAKPLDTYAKYPVWQSPEQKKEDPAEAKKTVIAWLESDEAQKFAKIVGPETFKKFVEQRLAVFAQEE